MHSPYLMVVLHFELGIFIMEVTASLLLVSQTMGNIVRGFRLIVQAPTFRASSMLLQLSLLPLVLGRAALPHSRSMVYVPPIWATLDCSACSPGDLVSILDIMDSWDVEYNISVHGITCYMLLAM